MAKRDGKRNSKETESQSAAGSPFLDDASPPSRNGRMLAAAAAAYVGWLSWLAYVAFSN